MRTVFISILHYNSNSDTINCLNSLLEAKTENIKLVTIVLDNGSKEKLKVREEDYKEIGLEVMVQEVNLGFTGGHNLIWERVRDRDFDYLLLLNNDSLVGEDCIQELANACEEQKVGAVVPKIYFTKGCEFHTTRYTKDEKGRVFWFAGGYIDWANVESVHIGVDEVDHGQYDKVEDINFATGACLLIKKSVLLEIGLFDNRYFLYYEDADLGQKIIKNQKRLLYIPKAVVWHNNAGSSGSGSMLHDYYLTRNKILFGMKYAPVRTKAHLINNGLKLMFQGKKKKKIGARDYFLNKFGKGSYK